MASSVVMLACWGVPLRPAEEARGAAIVGEDDRRAWRVATAMTLERLGAALGVSSAEVATERTPAGRPELAGAPARALRFNLSHARGLAACVIVEALDCGVDVEPVAPFDEDLARHVCSPAELAALLAAPGHARARRFTTLWAAKEAYLKGLGLGFGVEPREVDVRLGPAGHPFVRDAAPEWRLWRLPVAPGHAGVVAVRGPARIAVRAWPPTSVDAP